MSTPDAQASSAREMLVYLGPKAGISQAATDAATAAAIAASGGSYMRQAEKRAAASQLAAAAALQQIDRASSSQIAAAQASAASAIQALQAKYATQRCLVHVDADSFFASVHERDCPALKHIPVAVGGMSMISTANYEARKYGVRAAMPGFVAVKLCPQLKFVRSDFAAYVQAAAAMRHVMAKYDPAMRTMSLDEASLDITDYLVRTGVIPGSQLAPLSGASQHGAWLLPAFHVEPGLQWATYRPAIEAVVADMRAEIERITGGLTVSAGIGPNSLVAKIASDMHKPNGQTWVPFDAVQAWVGELQIRRLPFIGRVTEARLQALGMHTAADVVSSAWKIWMTHHAASAVGLIKTALGLRRVQRRTSDCTRRKSISAERTFSGATNRQELAERLAQLAHRVASSMARGDPPGLRTYPEPPPYCQPGAGSQSAAGVDNGEHSEMDALDWECGQSALPRVAYRAKVVTVKVKTTKFAMLSKQRALPAATRDASVIVSTALQLLEQLEFDELRLVGVRASDLVWDDGFAQYDSDGSDASVLALAQGASLGNASILTQFARAGAAIQQAQPSPARSTAKRPRADMTAIDLVSTSDSDSGARSVQPTLLAHAACAAHAVSGRPPGRHARRAAGRRAQHGILQYAVPARILRS